MKPYDHFAPHAALAQTLMAQAPAADDDAAHDFSHVLRVWHNVRRISAREGGSTEVLIAATLLHDCVNLPKDSPRRSAASALAAKKASGLLQKLGWPAPRIDAVAHAIEAHSFSAGITPRTLEARILQDADRLDALGHIGIARCFYVSGRLNRALYDPDDPAAQERPLDDLRFALDHFAAKLLRLSGTFQTETGAALAQTRHATLKTFVSGLLDEVTPPPLAD